MTIAHRKSSLTDSIKTSKKRPKTPTTISKNVQKRPKNGFGEAPSTLARLMRGCQRDAARRGGLRHGPRRGRLDPCEGRGGAGGAAHHAQHPALARCQECRGGTQPVRAHRTHEAAADRDSASMSCVLCIVSPQKTSTSPGSTSRAQLSRSRTPRCSGWGGREHRSICTANIKR